MRIGKIQKYNRIANFINGFYLERRANFICIIININARLLYLMRSNYK